MSDTHFPADQAERRVELALQAMRTGTAVVLLDDEERENEADLVFAAECIDYAGMTMLIRHCSGIVCLCLDDARCRQLNLSPMVRDNSSRHGTAFTVSIEAREGVTTGVSAADRLTTVRTAIAVDAQPEDLARPGHVFPLRAAEGGVLTRPGHTEGTVDLARLAGLSPAGVLCELMNDDGTMARGEQIYRFAAERNLPLLLIQDLIQWRRQRQSVDVDTQQRIG